MKKYASCLIGIIAGLMAGLLIAVVVYEATDFSLFGDGGEYLALPADSGNTELVALALAVVDDIKAGDYRSLSLTAHPELGVLFSPYATINLSTAKCFSADQIASFPTDTHLYVWGVYTGSGEPIELTAADYFARFVFDRDYTAASMIGVDRVVRSGNALENMAEVLPGVKYVDLHITGTDEDSPDNYCWSSLRLGFEEYEGGLKLTVILHSEWAE